MAGGIGDNRPRDTFGGTVWDRHDVPGAVRTMCRGRSPEPGRQCAAADRRSGQLVARPDACASAAPEFSPISGAADPSAGSAPSTTTPHERSPQPAASVPQPLKHRRACIAVGAGTSRPQWRSPARSAPPCHSGSFAAASLTRLPRRKKSDCRPAAAPTFGNLEPNGVASPAPCLDAGDSKACILAIPDVRQKPTQMNLARARPSWVQWPLPHSRGKSVSPGIGKSLVNVSASSCLFSFYSARPIAPAVRSFPFPANPESRLLVRKLLERLQDRVQGRYA